MSNSLQPHGLQYSRLPCPSLSSRVCKVISIESVMPSNGFILCCPLFLLPSVFPSFRVFKSGGKSIGTSASASVLPMNIKQLISFKIDWFDLLDVQGTLKCLLQHHNSKASILQCSAFSMVQLSYAYMTTGKTTALTIWTFLGKVMPLPFFVVVVFKENTHLVFISQYTQSPNHNTDTTTNIMITGNSF